jgi:hypothetical protein
MFDFFGNIGTAIGSMFVDPNASTPAGSNTLGQSSYEKK